MQPAIFDLRSDPVGAYPEEWTEALASLHERPFRARQVFRWIHTRSVADPAGMTDIARSLRDKLSEWKLAMPAKIDSLGRGNDGTRKALVSFVSGGGTVETVLIPPMDKDHGEDEPEDEDEESPSGAGPSGAGLREAPRRVTQCISTQVGCAMGCVFCASGVAGLKRHLSAGEIVAQVLLGRTLLEPAEALRNVVLMGMGEPLHNYERVARALRLLTHKDGLDLSTRRVTVSTSGLVPEIDRLGQDFHGEIALAISLHAPDDDTRSALMPINRKYPVSELMAAIKRYPLARRRRITIEYTLLSGINDSDAQARAVIRLLRGIPVKINLIPMNPVEGAPYKAPDWDRVLGFQQVLRNEGLSVFIRRTRGDDIRAACGQLALQGAQAVKRKLPVFGPLAHK